MFIILRIYIMGLSVLAGAIAYNAFNYMYSITSWYDLFKGLSDHGLSYFMDMSLISYLSLIILYPFVLGICGYIGYTATRWSH
jgi:hypothetical protein